MDKSYFDLQDKLVDKLQNELYDEDREKSNELQIKKNIVDYIVDNDNAILMHIDFLSALYEQDNSLDYICNNAKDIPLSRLINKISKEGIITFAETLELIGDDAYCEKVDNQRMQKIDGHAYFIRKPTSLDEVNEYTQTYENRNSSQRSPYHVFKTIELDAIKYDDFINSRLGYTHQFIADNAEGCHENKFGILQCIRVVNKDKPDEKLLIQSEGYDYARYAAIERKPKELEQKKSNNKSFER